MMKRVVVVGAGIGGLTAAALLAKAGLDVTVLEAHIYGGGCAGTFYHQGYRFDAGATLVAGFDADGGMSRLGEALGIAWPVEPAAVAMRVHLSDGAVVTRWTAEECWRAERLAAFGPAAEPFWRWQEETADRLWNVALRGVPWPPQAAADFWTLGKMGAELAWAAPRRLPGLGLDAFRPLAAHLRGASPRLQRYVDGQLLIAAQTTAGRANALYAAAALDMPRREVAHVRGGVGKLADVLAVAVQRHGGQVYYRQRVSEVARPGRAFRVTTQRHAVFEADAVLFNLTPHDAAALLAPDLAARLPHLKRAAVPADGWGAFMVYVGLDAAAVPADLPLHHQVLAADPPGEGNSIFLSLSLPDDPGRAPAGGRALTISMHTAPRPWWALFETDRSAYEARKQEYTERILTAAETVLPGLRSAARLVLPGTPISFQRFTGRSLGWVGGFPQTSLFRTWGPRLGEGLWLVGDSIFPGQSALATALGGAQVARQLLAASGRRVTIAVTAPT